MTAATTAAATSMATVTLSRDGAGSITIDDTVRPIRGTDLDDDPFVLPDLAEAITDQLDMGGWIMSPLPPNLERRSMPRDQDYCDS